jgi:hypothetical protein
MPGFQQFAMGLAMTPRSRQNTDDLRIREFRATGAAGEWSGRGVNRGSPVVIAESGLPR